MKTCNRCNQTLPREDFYRMSSALDGRQSCCIACRKAYNDEHREHTRNRHRDYLIRTGRRSGDGRPRMSRIEDDSPSRDRLARYQLTHAGFESILVTQGFRCAICYRDGDLAIDHDHETGEVRGLLCRQCNVGLGLLGDTANAVDRVTAYLSRWMHQ